MAKATVELQSTHPQVNQLGDLKHKTRQISPNTFNEPRTCATDKSNCNLFNRPYSRKRQWAWERPSDVRGLIFLAFPRTPTNRNRTG